MMLKTNHRQGNDKAYAELLNRVRVGEQNQEDMELLRTRVRPTNHPDLREASLYIVCKRKDCATSFLNEVTVKIGAKVMIIHNIDTTDSPTNGQIKGDQKKT